MDTEGYQALFDGAADAIVLADTATGCIEAMNSRARRLFGYTPEELTRLSYRDVFDQRTRQQLDALAQDPEVGDLRVPDGEVTTRDGSRRPVDLAASVVKIGTRSLIQINLRDEAERRRAEAELLETRRRLEEQNAELRQAQDRLIEVDRVRAEFLGMMSHELRTPVNILIGYAHMLLESVAAGDPLPASERAGILRRMVAGGHTLSELVEDTLSVLRLDAVAVRLDLEPLALDALFHDLKGNDRLLRGPDAVDERWVVEPDVPQIITDRRKLRQVITNLVGNARKFTKNGYIEVRGVVAGPAGVRISVTDTGCGISPEHLANVFDLYRQAPSGQAHDGCGIGLYIVRRYVEMLQGQVQCRSIVGEGSTFTLELPQRIELLENTEEQRSANSHAASPAAAG